MEPAAGAPGVLQEAQVRRSPGSTSARRVPAPEASAEPQGPGVVVGRVAALAPRNAVDGMLDQPGRVRHAIQVIQRDSQSRSCITGLRASEFRRARPSPPGVANDSCGRARSGRSSLADATWLKNVQILPAHIRPEHRPGVFVGPALGFDPERRVAQESQRRIGQGVALRRTARAGRGLRPGPPRRTGRECSRRPVPRPGHTPTCRWRSGPFPDRA